MYRFLLTPRWLGFALLAIVLAGVMVFLGFWQLDRYHQRDAVNARVAAAAHADPVPVRQVLGLSAPPDSVAWTRVTVTGRYDAGHRIIARARTLHGTVGFEVFNPILLPDGTAVLVDRGWLAPPSSGGAGALPDIPPVPTGQVTVVGRVHLPESRPSQPTGDGTTMEVRRVSPAVLAAHLPYRLLGGYVLADEQSPVPNDPAFQPIPAEHQNSTMNAGYVVQWWIFALLVLAGFVWAARREARGEGDRFGGALDDDLDLKSLESGKLPEAPVSPPL